MRLVKYTSGCVCEGGHLQRLLMNRERPALDIDGPFSQAEGSDGIKKQKRRELENASILFASWQQ